MIKLTVYAYAVLIGTNCLAYYSKDVPYFSYAALTMLIVCLFNLAFTKQAQNMFKSLQSIDVMLWCVLLCLPLLYLVLSDEIFERGVWMSYIISLVMFGLMFIFTVNSNFRSIIAYAALTIVIISSGMNIYELLFENNLWSTAPGRSAGWYENPNISAGAITAYGIIYFSHRKISHKRLDFAILSLTGAGVLSTFSRMGFFLLPCDVLAMSLSYFESNNVKTAAIKTAGIYITMLTLFLLGANVISEKMDLSQDALIRLMSFEQQSVRDVYVENRGGMALAAWDLFLQHPLTGLGVRTSLQPSVIPHNMFVGVAVDYGIFGLLVYLGAILRWLWLGIKKLTVDSKMAWLMLIAWVWIVIFSFASHNIIYDATDLLVVAIVLAMSSASSRLPNASKSTATRAWPSSYP
ncbi:O-Antigen ligase [Candidatus Methylomirabilis lanthanidiphila]|uniref:O-Antigen ligase n=1 Tax=Candidatus Methylomirabilis lanthanidiphila TaxID=2211376 RepID=A0A564ZJF0_9BACT|nr:O-Antigen ligase [Candidatus Methylomirabilis lanthanidiphila]